MISLLAVTDTPIVDRQPRPLALNVTLNIPPGRYVLLAQNLQLRKPAIDLFARLRPPMSGEIVYSGASSWPIGRTSFLRSPLTGFELIDLIARLYELDREMCYWVAEEMLTNPARLQDTMTSWQPMERFELGHILSLLPRFNVYLLDGPLPYRNDRFTELWRPLFARRIEGRTLILSAVRASDALEFCDAALVLRHGQLHIEAQIERLLNEFPVRAIANERLESSEPSGSDASDDDDL